MTTKVVHYLIWSNEHGAWWRPGMLGYTTEVAEAGRYDCYQASDIVTKAGAYGPLGKGIPNEVMVLAPEHSWHSAR